MLLDEGAGAVDVHVIAGVVVPVAPPTVTEPADFHMLGFSSLDRIKPNMIALLNPE